MLAPAHITDPITRNLFHALHSHVDADKRWSQRKESGLTDEQLTEAIRYEFGIWGGYYGGGNAWNAKGEGKPKFWHGRDWHGVKPTLEGKALLAATRELLSIPQPVGQRKQAEQMSLFEFFQL